MDKNEGISELEQKERLWNAERLAMRKVISAQETTMKTFEKEAKWKMRS